MAWIDGGYEKVCASVEDRGELCWNEYAVGFWGSEMSERVLVVEKLFSLEDFAFRHKIRDVGETFGN